MFSSAMILVPLIGYGLFLALIIIFVVSHKRLAAVHQDLADAHKEMSKQLSHIAIELRHQNSK